MNRSKKCIFTILLMLMVVIVGITGCSKSRPSKNENETSSVTGSTNREPSSSSGNIYTTTNKNKDQDKEESKTEEENTEEEESKPEENKEEEATTPEESTESEDAHGSSKASSSAINAFAKLLSGNTSFVSGKVNPNVDEALRNDLVVNGQHPYAIVITCSDSRVPAELIFDAGLGEIFVIRTAGNVVSSFEIGSVEYGAEHLGSPLVLVLGHTNCGAVTAATEGGEAGGSIQAIVDEIAPSVAKARETATEETLLSKAIELNVKNSINKIRQSHIMNELEEEGKVAIIGGVYDIQHGTIKIIE